MLDCLVQGDKCVKDMWSRLLLEWNGDCLNSRVGMSGEPGGSIVAPFDRMTSCSSSLIPKACLAKRLNE